MKIYKESNYGVHPDGQVQNLKTGKFLAKHGNGRGYYKVHLMIEGKRKSLYVHRLVADLYIVKPRKRHCNQVNHKDGDKSNNCAANLEWLTNGENQRHAHKEGLKPKAKLSAKDVRAIRRSKQIAKNLAEQYRVSTSAIYKIKNRKMYKYV
jgi:hypothetical protein